LISSNIGSVKVDAISDNTCDWGRGSSNRGRVGSGAEGALGDDTYFGMVTGVGEAEEGVGTTRGVVDSVGDGDRRLCSDLVLSLLVGEPTARW
jgi:hypothetical protein